MHAVASRLLDSNSQRRVAGASFYPHDAARTRCVRTNVLPFRHPPHAAARRCLIILAGLAFMTAVTLIINNFLSNWFCSINLEWLAWVFVIIFVILPLLASRKQYQGKSLHPQPPPARLSPPPPHPRRQGPS